MSFPPTYAELWDITQPPDTQLANLLGQDIRNLKNDIMQRFSLLSGLLANQPTPDTVNATWGGSGFGILYFATDTSQIFQWNGSDWVDISGSFLNLGYMFLGSSVTQVSVADTTVLTPLQNISIPANYIGVGQTFELEMFGEMTIGASGDSITLGLYLDSVSLCSMNFNLAAATAQGWHLRGLFTGLTTGATGTITGGYMEYGSTPSGGGYENSADSDSPAASITINTTVSHNLRVQVQWAQAHDTLVSYMAKAIRIG